MSKLTNLRNKMSKLSQLRNEILERESYLKQINEQIEFATQDGADAIRELSAEVESLSREKARLCKQLLSLEQSIREAKLVKTSL
jgi:hypothetical protein